MTPHPHAAYRSISVDTLSPERLILMLYDGLLKFLGQAHYHAKEDEWPLAYPHLMRSLAILEELNVALNMSAGEVSSNLRDLYNFCLRRILSSVQKKDISPLSDVTKIILSLRDAWEMSVIQRQTEPQNAPHSGARSFNMAA